MKLTVDRVFNLARALNAILNERRMLPLKGTYRLTRLRAKLAPEYEVIAAKRNEVIFSYGYKGRPDGTTDEEAAMMADPPPLQAMVPPDKEDEFRAFWTAFGAETIEVDVEPIPFSQLDLGPNVPAQLSGAEIDLLGDVIVDDSQAAQAA
jgi:hypothetical protein